MNKRLESLKPLDVILFILVLAVAIASGIGIYGNRAGQVHLVIEASGNTWMYDLETERTIEIKGVLGNTTIQVKNKEARITASPCPNKTCIASHAISQKGEWNACLPNKVLLRIEGNEKSDEIDALVN